MEEGAKIKNKIGITIGYGKTLISVFPIISVFTSLLITALLSFFSFIFRMLS